MTPISIIKKSGKIEPFNERKIIICVRLTCLKAHTPAGEAETTAGLVSKEVAAWLTDKPEVTSTDIRHKIAERLKIYDPKAAQLIVRAGR
jgi:transcriptional regulator NrdR family protein